MKAFIVIVVLFFATLAFGASNEDGKGKETTPSTENGYNFYGTGDVFKSRPARWQGRVKSSGWLGGSPRAIHPAIMENDPEYYPKLFNLLEKVGRR